MTLAPIVLFVYNRPEHTRRAIEALQHDPLAARSDLVIFADGPKGEKDRRKVLEVRELLKSVAGFRRVVVRDSEINRGLANSIIEGVTSIVQEYGRVIVLEDDLVVSPQFLTYMNNALTAYADVDRVMHISGYWYPVSQEGLPATFFLRLPSSWGWATWARAWRWFEKNPGGLRKCFSTDEIRQFNLDGANNFWEQVVHNINGKANTWAIFWYAAIFRKNGVCLYPSRSLVNNMGMDGTGVHCLITNVYECELAMDHITKFPQSVEEDRTMLELLKLFYIKNRVGRIRRFIEVTKIKLKNIIE